MIAMLRIDRYPMPRISCLHAISTVGGSAPARQAPGHRSPLIGRNAFLRDSAFSDYNNVFAIMADRLYLSIWFPSFQEPEMLPRLLSVLRQFPFSADRGGIGYLGIRSISWDQPIIFQE